ncbi:X15341 cytochrome C oxidase subunit [Athelia psychrophila]|uniref:X15341 cytochrome C oxidase subunit n=1 Tax=Athelia psychrophila TaxID=1759441 RepID=A0A166FIP4_9AGAM|nr:X15341 cytochrome C oxidase subunit [Fibularhizoctonia sp. CBS 109695]
MSFFVRGTLRSTARLAPRRARMYSEEIQPTMVKPTAEWQAQQDALTHHAAEAADLWRKISFYVCLPAILAGSIYVYNVEAKHKAHMDHLLEENDGVLPQPPAYEYLNRRVKPFPWGMNSLFYNPKVNRNMEE